MDKTVRDRSTVKFMAILLIGVALVIALYAMVCLGLRQWQTRLIFFPNSHLDATPASVGLAYEAVELRVGQGQEMGTVQGWWIPSEAPVDHDLTPLILYFHGNGSNLGDLSEMALRFHRLGWTSFLMDYRGYGGSQGPFPNEQRVYEDAEAVWRYLVEQRQILPQQIVLYGHSLGGAIAIELATRHPVMAGVIVESSFTSMRDMVMGQGRYKLLPIDWVLTQRFESIDKVRSLSIPFLFLHGIEDEVVPASMSQALYDATIAPKDVVFIADAGHNDLPHVGGDVYVQALQSFVCQWVALPSSLPNSPSSFSAISYANES